MCVCKYKYICMYVFLYVCLVISSYLLLVFNCIFYINLSKYSAPLYTFSNHLTVDCQRMLLVLSPQMYILCIKTRTGEDVFHYRAVTVYSKSKYGRVKPLQLYFITTFEKRLNSNMWQAGDDVAVFFPTQQEKYLHLEYAVFSFIIQFGCH